MDEDNIYENEDVLLQVKDLDVRFYTEEGELKAVQGAAFNVKSRRTLGIVGESGCGKSVSSFALMQLIGPPGKIMGGEVLFRSDKGIVDILKMPSDSQELRKIRGGQIGMIFQEPMSALFPLSTIGSQLMEAVMLHRSVSKKEAREVVIEMLGKVGIPSPDQRVDQYIHELSGGMRQRVVIALALICKPKLIIADEPTTALDVTIQAQVLDVIKDMQEELHAACILITHDLSVIAQYADEVTVMYLGREVEHADVRTLIRKPRHPYTRGLIKSIPSLDHDSDTLFSIKGDVPNLNNMPSGCPFHPRCPFAVKGTCDVGAPPAQEKIAENHYVACVRVHEIEHEAFV